MSSVLSTILVVLWFFLVVFIGCLWLRKCLGCGNKNNLVESNCNRSTSESPGATQDVWSVSREINQVYGPPPNYQWPTHDHHVSLDSFSLRPVHPSFIAPPTTLTNDPGGEKIAPPPYSEMDLPSYEEVVTAEAQNQNVYEPVPAVRRTQVS